MISGPIPATRRSPTAKARPVAATATIALDKRV